MIIYDSSANITSCIFTDNRANYRGGVMSIICVKFNEFNVTNCTFVNNGAGVFAGVIFVACLGKFL